MLRDRPQYGLSATRDIAQQYSSASIISLRSHSPKKKISVGLKNVITVIWFYFYLKTSNYGITKLGKCLLAVCKYR